MSLLFVLSMLLTAPETATAPLVYFDMQACLKSMPDDSVARYDALKLVASLQGLVNREKPQLAIRFLESDGRNVDDYWLDVQRRGWLKDTPVEQESDLIALLRRFPKQVTGLVMWDQNVAATANVAATICGVDGLLPLRVGSPLIPMLEKAGVLPPVKMNLTGMFTGKETGSAKCDAYLWAKREYLDKGKCREQLLTRCDSAGGGKCSPTLMANYIDGYSQSPGKPGFEYPDLFNATLANHDFYIAKKAFFFDLSPWGDEAPVDDPAQPLGTDKNTLIALLKSQCQNNGGKAFTSVGGFTPWNLKYTNHGPAGGKHEPVPTEWEYAAILSAHNALMDADALGLGCLANASAYMHCPLKERYEQNPKPKPGQLADKTYVLIYMGDYDAASWLSRSIPRVWDDPARGSLPIAWAFNPNLAERVPYVFDHIYATKSPNDWFIGGDSGAGYVNPNLLTGDRLGSGLPDALPMWIEHNRRWYGRFDYTITGFAINGFHGSMPLKVQEAYAEFSPDGVGMQLGFEQPLVGVTPFLRHSSDIYPDGRHLEKAAAQMARFAKTQKPQFLIFRWILQDPTTLKGVYEIMQRDYPKENWEFCDPYTFFGLYRQSLEKKSSLSQERMHP